ncbi:Severe Depolymerization of Actin [Coemansia sp. RSA 1813]|nr:Severe Depolymerization of Actin [Coemansia sp. RSA 1646]KAJ1774023.1 Severe Depolymerization of Actin [Coemansia sp. RSA 1843]KAJ2092587.1 Severe Depolymerization of Actin [Coemansia sp. RSA 986]KAJ2216718.1 Severe Depolymerization of Actin [Coemansia sp. RSA 487]KAJ2572792.1 Severe Depolymerization of Actin [Coemansia sp. RSA 1813]
MVRRDRATQLLNNLPQLQNLIKRDPPSYQEEFQQQLHHFEASLAIFELKPEEEAKGFGDLINFIAQVAKCYPEQCARFPAQLMDLLQRHYQVLNADLRKAIVQALILLRNRGVVSNLQVMPLFFTLFRCHDKVLRKLLYTHIVNDVKLANKGKHRNHKLNKTLQGFMYTMMSAADAQDKHGEGAIAAKKSLDVCIELYRKNIWTDAKAVNVIAQACFSPITKIMVTAVQFFLSPRKKSKDGDESESETEEGQKESRSRRSIQLVLHQSKINKKTKHRKRLLEKANRARKLNQARDEGILNDDEDDYNGDNKGKSKAPPVSFDVLSLIHDPQGFSEKLFARVHSSTTATKRGGSTVDRFEVRLLLLKLISRLVGHHQLQLIALYPFLQRYLQPHQIEVTQILALLATATHAFMPPDVLQPLIRTIADNFVSDHCSPEVMCAGLNTIRAIAARQPLAIEADLLNDLILYRKHRDRGVMMAARSLLMLYRQLNPEMLHRRDRGREVTLNLLNGKAAKPLLRFGEVRVADGVDGGELLEEHNDGESVSSSEDGLESDPDIVDTEDEAVDAPAEDSSDSESDHSTADATEMVHGSEDADDDSNALESPGGGGAMRIDMVRALTDEDFAQISHLKKLKRSGKLPIKGLKRKAEDEMSISDEEANNGDGNEASSSEDEDEKEYLDEADILGDYHTRRRRRKTTYEERTQTIMAGREGREKFSSKKAKREKEGRSLSNREKRKTKDFKMISHKRSVVSKGKRSLVQKRHELRKHVTKQKKKGF